MQSEPSNVSTPTRFRVLVANAAADWSAEPCPIARGIDAIGDPWVLLILREALTGAARFEDFRERLGLAENTLAARLKDMAAVGLLEAVPTSAGPRPRHRYELTDAGREALPVLHSFAVWARKHTPTTPRTDLEVYCRGCGAAVAGVESCASCGRPMGAASTRWVRNRK